MKEQQHELEMQAAEINRLYEKLAQLDQSDQEELDQTESSSTPDWRILGGRFSETLEQHEINHLAKLQKQEKTKQNEAEREPLKKLVAEKELREQNEPYVRSSEVQKKMADNEAKIKLLKEQATKKKEIEQKKAEDKRVEEQAAKMLVLNQNKAGSAPVNNSNNIGSKIVLNPELTERINKINYLPVKELMTSLLIYAISSNGDNNEKSNYIKDTITTDSNNFTLTEINELLSKIKDFSESSVFGEDEPLHFLRQPTSTDDLSSSFSSIFRPSPTPYNEIIRNLSRTYSEKKAQLELLQSTQLSPNKF